VVLGTATTGPGVIPPAITANEETVYWGDPGGQQIMACDVGGCADGGRVFADAAVSSVHADETALYWTSTVNAIGEVYKTPLDGGATATLATKQRGPSHVLANGACVYWTDDAFVGVMGATGQVWGIPQP
jgi:hypothetical protein